MTSTASLHFGPEWMRKPARQAPPASPNPPVNSNGIPPNSNHTNAPTPAPNSVPHQSSYSSFLTTSTSPPDTRQDDAHPFRYSKEYMLAIWKEGGGQGELGVEVERWPGIVREEADEPMGLKELSAEDKRLFSLPYNSDPPQIRRRGDSYSSHPPLNTMPSFDSTSRNKLASPMRDRYGNNPVLGSPNGPAGGPISGGGLNRRRKDENGQDAPLYRPRQLSLGGSMVSNPGPPSPGVIPPSPGVTNGRPRIGGGTFDGVLGTESWGNTIRRRVSEPRIPQAKPDDKMSGPWRTGDGGAEKVKNGIEEEPLDDWEQEVPGPEIDTNGPKSTSPTNVYDTDGSNRAPSVEPGRSVGSRPASGASGKVINDLVDPLTTQWQYRDPSGQLQGPFAATVMQAWFESGYFTEDLMLKRVDLDDDFDPLVEYRRRVVPPGTDQKLFISVIASKLQVTPAPPGLARPTPPINDLLGTPPVNPPTTVRTSFAPSPTSAATPFNPGNVVNGVASVPVVAAVEDAEKQRRERDEFFRILREKELANQTNQLNGIVGLGSPTPGPAFGAFSASTLGRNPLRVNTNSSDILGGGTPALNNFSAQSPIQQQSPFASTALGGFGGSLGSPVAMQESSMSPLTANANPLSLWGVGSPPSVPQSDSFRRNSPAVGTPQGGSPWHSIIEPAGTTLPASFSGNFTPIQSVWGNQPVSSPQASAFQDPVQSAAKADFPQLGQVPLPSMQSPGLPDRPDHQSLPTHSTSQPSSVTPSVSSPIAPSVPETALSEVSSPTGPAEKLAGSSEEELLESKDSPVSPPAEAIAQLRSQDSTQPSKPNSKSNQGHSKTPSKDSTSAKSAATPATAPEPLIPAPAHASLPPKPAWSIGTFDEKGSLSGSGTTMSLRQIQEAEAKRSQELKKQERERAKVAATSAATTPTAAAPAVDTTTTWGLPQVGKAAPSAAVSTPTSASPSPANSTLTPGGAWTTKPAQASKKTMKEIQEEEEKRKKEAASNAAATREAQAAAAAAAKRGYADSAKTSGTAPSTPTLANSAWTTIGANGKAAAPPSTTSALNPPRTVTPTSSVLRPSVASVAASAAPTPVKQSQAAKATATAKAADEIPSPSLDFVKWMRDALKGLSGVNLDEFLQFLLQFPLDPAPSDLELISDTVYSYSSTLDGRWFVSEFVSKRKADAANAKNVQPKSAIGVAAGSGVASSGKGSLADVVKTQPKPAQTDFGYKVVNKKKGKSGRGSTAN